MRNLPSGPDLSQSPQTEQAGLLVNRPHALAFPNRAGPLRARKSPVATGPARACIMASTRLRRQMVTRRSEPRAATRAFFLEAAAVSDRSESDLTRTLKAVTEGRSDPVQVLLPAVYEELRGLAARYLLSERPGLTFSATALVHEAYLKLIEQHDVRWQNRAHFLAIAAQAIRRILVDHARSRGRDKRGGGWQRVPLSAIDPETPLKDLNVLALEEALERLSREEPIETRIVEMRFFGGMQIQEIAQVLNVAERTVRRRLAFAKAWLFRELTKEGAT